MMAVDGEIRKRFGRLSDANMHRLLTPPNGPVRIILDTDAANEIDDQFALAWALLSPDRVEIEGGGQPLASGCRSLADQMGPAQSMLSSPL